MYGHELHGGSAREARRILSAAGCSAEVSAGDFFHERPDRRFDAAVGNPPYVRYQSFVGASRAVSREAASRAGVSLTRLASSWAVFAVHAALFLRPGGRLGLVLPAELLSVNYAAEVRRFLMRHFGRVRLVPFTERVPGSARGVVLLLAEGTGPTDHCELLQVRDVEELSAASGVTSTWRPTEQAGKWTAALMPPAALEAFTAAVGHPGFTTLHTWGETTLGAVTGNDKWFTMSPGRARELRLADEELLRLSPPGSVTCAGCRSPRRPGGRWASGGRAPCCSVHPASRPRPLPATSPKVSAMAWIRPTSAESANPGGGSRWCRPRTCCSRT